MMRKGFMYTIAAIILLMVVGAVFLTQVRRMPSESRAAVSARVQTMNDFIHSFGTDSQRAAYISGFHAMIGMEQYITDTGTPIAVPQDVFKQLFTNGSISNMTFVIMQNSTFNDYLGRVQYNAAQEGIGFSANVVNVTLWQVDPWGVLVNYTLDVNLTDNRGTANWSFRRTFTGRVPITDLRDPLFTARTYSRIQRVIKQSNITVLVNDTGNANDTTGLMQHFNSSYYIANGKGPNILMRFQGNTSDDQFGIESLVDTDDMTAQGVAFNASSSVVDYLFFNNTRADACSIQNVPTKIKIDNGHLTTYQIQGKLTYSACP